MKVPAPHFLLFSEATEAPADGVDAGCWKFVLEASDGSGSLEAADQECETSAERLELLAVIRGLEALDQPSRVTLTTRNRQISRGLRYGLENWRENDWQWERFGEMKPVKNSDLWKRIDQAVRIHQVDCRAWKSDTPDDLSEAPVAHAPAPIHLRSGDGRMLRIDPASKGNPRTPNKSQRSSESAPTSWTTAIQRWLGGLLQAAAA